MTWNTNFRKWVTALALGLCLLSAGAWRAASAQPPTPQPGSVISPKELASYDNFGADMALQAGWLAAGAPGTDLEGARNAGAAYLFQRQGAGWVETQRLTPDPAQADGRFGSALALDGKWLAVGAPYEYNPGGGNASGAVYLFEQGGKEWTQRARLASPDSAPFDLFGWRLALKGDLLVVGAPAADGAGGSRNAGAVYVYRRSGSAWSLEARLSGGDAAPEDRFGWALAIEGTSLLVGAPGHDMSGAENSGMLYVFGSQGGGWGEVQRLTAGQLKPDAHFGSSLSLDGGSLAVLASQEYAQGEMPPSLYLYGGDFGVAHIFEQRGGRWEWTTSLAPRSQDPETESVRLRSIALDGGAGRLALSGFGRGAIYRYARQGKTWQELPSVMAPSMTLVDPATILIDGDIVLLSTRFYDHVEPYAPENEGLYSAGAVLAVDW